MPVSSKLQDAYTARTARWPMTLPGVVDRRLTAPSSPRKRRQLSSYSTGGSSYSTGDLHSGLLKPQTSTSPPPPPLQCYSPQQLLHLSVTQLSASLATAHFAYGSVVAPPRTRVGTQRPGSCSSALPDGPASSQSPSCPNQPTNPNQLSPCGCASCASCGA